MIRLARLILALAAAGACVPALALDIQADVGGAQDVTCGVEAHREAGRDLDVAFMVMSLQLLQAATGVLFRIERSRLLVLRVALARGVLRLFFQQVPAVGKQQAAQRHAAVGAVDPAAEPLLDECGQVARMVQVGVGQDHRID